MEKDRSAYLFQRYASKTCTPAERQEFMEMVRHADDNHILNIILDNFWNNSPEISLNNKKTEGILHQIFSAEAQPIIKKQVLPWKWFGWAAAIFIVSIIAILANNHDQKIKSTANQSVKKLNKAPVSETITINSKTEHQKVTLPDGSTVILNNNSSISFAKIFKGNRIVSLTGEGYFDIKHDDHKTFTVYAGRLKTTVLGTAFNIKAYDLDKNVQVTVTRGKVSVLNQDSTLSILLPNQQITFNKEQKKSNLSKVVAKAIIQWQEGDLFFDDTTMEEAAIILSKKFSTNIMFTNEQAKKCRFSATFLKGESLTEILKLICSFNNATYQENANGITINGQGCE